jgi:hypothetical protein
MIRANIYCFWPQLIEYANNFIYWAFCCKMQYFYHHKRANSEVLCIRPYSYISDFMLPTTITYKAILNIKYELKSVCEAIDKYYGKAINPTDDYGIYVINSNFTNLCRPGYESHIKQPKEMVRRQGNGSSFGSCIEFLILLKSDSTKFYKPKCFPQDGIIQILGIRHANLSDAHEVVKYIIELFKNVMDIEEPIQIQSERKSLINYKFNLNFWSPKNIIDVNMFQIILCDIIEKRVKYEEDFIRTEIYKKNIIHMRTKLPAKITTSRQQLLDNKLILAVEYSDKYIMLIKFELSGKFTITASREEKDSYNMYCWIKEFFKIFWNYIIRI